MLTLARRRVCSPQSAHVGKREFWCKVPFLSLEKECHMQTRCEESHAHRWPWPSDVARALVFLIVSVLFVLASVNVPA
jgi:hypothetical protein